VNVLSKSDQQKILILVDAGLSYREIQRKTGHRRETISKYVRDVRGPDPKAATSEGVATGSATENRPGDEGRPPAPEATTSVSACEPYREWIEAQLRLSRNATAIYQDLVDGQGFTARYNSVKRFVARLKHRDPEQFDILDSIPGEEAQVDYGLGAPAIHPKTGHYRTPRLFVMTLKYSRRAFRRVVFNSSQEVWARLHDEAFRYFGGVPQYVVLDNLKEGVITPDIYEPELNPLYSQMLAHHGVVADPARIKDPDRKGTVEKAIDHTQMTALKGRKFDTLEEENAFLEHWESRWAAKRVHGRAKRQVEEMFEEEKKFLRPLPLSPFRYFRQEFRTVGMDGMIEVERSYYFAAPRFIGLRIPVKIFEQDLEILDPKTLELVRRHSKSIRPGQFSIDPHERVFNPTRDVLRLLDKAKKIGSATGAFCEELLREQGRPGVRRVLSIVGLTRKFSALKVESATRTALERGIWNARTVRIMVEREAAADRDAVAQQELELVQQHQLIREPDVYAAHFSQHAVGPHGFNPSQNSSKGIFP
jgi:transposase